MKPMSQGFDPLAKEARGLGCASPPAPVTTFHRCEESKTEWEVIEDADCPSVENVAQAFGMAFFLVALCFAKLSPARRTQRTSTR